MNNLGPSKYASVLVSVCSCHVIDHAHPSQCLWKLTRQIPQVVDLLNLDQLLLDMHQFMMGYLRIVPLPSPDDIPFRTVKTVLFHLTNTVGPKVSGWGQEVI